jgi:hypothetical protein
VAHKGEEGEGVVQGFWVYSPCCSLEPAGRRALPRGKPSWLGEREKKEKFNLVSFKLNVLGKLTYVITLIKQYLYNYI